MGCQVRRGNVTGGCFEAGEVIGDLVLVFEMRRTPHVESAGEGTVPYSGTGGKIISFTGGKMNTLFAVSATSLAGSG